MARIVVQTDDFDSGAEQALLLNGRADIGGVGCFIGVVRGGPVRALTLEHYPGMTERALADIARQAEARWPLLGCTIIHRVGRLLPGDRIVLAMAAAAHRDAALAATGFLIDWLKTKAPFWKQEERGDGSLHWVEARDEDEQAAARWNP